ADGSSYGSLRFADITLPVSMKTASSVVVQVIGDPLYPTVPSTCPGPAENTVTAFGANGILGVGPFAQDCGSACVATAQPSTYYSCPSTSTCGASTGNSFTDSPLPACPTPNTGFYCPASTMMETATLQGTNTTTTAANFSVANASTLFANFSYTAFSNLGGTNPDANGFDLGLP